MQKNSVIVNEIEIDGSIFFVRGLTVGEYSNLIMSNKLSNSDTFFVSLPKLCLVGWKGVESQEYTKPLYELMEHPQWPNIPDEYIIEKEVEFSPDKINDLPYEVVLRLGKEIFNTYTMLSQQEVEYFKGATRFLNFLSRPENKAKADRYDCNVCIQGGHRDRRICSKFTDEEAKTIKDYLSNSEDDEISEQEIEDGSTVPSKDLASKYKSVRKKKMAFKTDKPEAEVVKVNKGAVKVGGFVFEECPVSWLPSWVSTLTGIFYHCSQSNIPFVSGGICDQPYKLYSAERIVAGENSKIEMEEMEKTEKDRNRKGRKR